MIWHVVNNLDVIDCYCLYNDFEFANNCGGGMVRLCVSDLGVYDNLRNP